MFSYFRDQGLSEPEQRRRGTVSSTGPKEAKEGNRYVMQQKTKPDGRMNPSRSEGRHGGYTVGRYYCGFFL